MHTKHAPLCEAHMMEFVNEKTEKRMGNGETLVNCNFSFLLMFSKAFPIGIFETLVCWLTQSYKILTLTTLNKKPLENILRKGETNIFAIPQVRIVYLSLVFQVIISQDCVFKSCFPSHYKSGLYGEGLKNANSDCRAMIMYLHMYFLNLQILHQLL